MAPAQLLPIAFPLASGDAFTVQDVPGKGRGLVATRAIPAGTTIFTEDAITLAVDLSHENTHCSHCFRSSKDVDVSAGTTAFELSRCARCKSVRYCSAQCQRKDWTRWHRLECSMLAMLAPRQLPSLAACLNRMLLTRRRVADALTTTASADAQKIDAVLAGLESHREMQSPEKLGQLGELCVALSAQWSKMEEDASASDGDAESNRTAMGLGSATELMDVLCKLCVNMVAISDNDLAAVGVGLYPTNALVNHSCRPNVVPLFDGARLHLQAMERIEPGTELCATYVDLMQPTGARKKALRETYCFECQCPACAAVPLLNDPLETYRCVNADCKGSGFSVPDDLTQSVVDKGPSAEPINIECPDCRSVLLGFQQTITKVLDSQKLYNEAITLSQQAMDDSATARYLDLLQRAHTVQQAHLSPTNAMLYRTSCELVMALCQNGQWKRAMIISNTIIAQQERFLPGAHNPLRGIYLYINARIAAWMDNLEFAIGQLERALTILRVGGTPLRRLIDRAAREHQELQYELRRRAAA